MIAFLALRLAEAHVPHDTVRALAAPADLDEGVPWTLLADPQGIYLLLDSTDGGVRWAMVGGEPVVDDLTDATYLSDGTEVLLGGGELWERQGDEAWSPFVAPTGTAALERDGDDLLLAAADGVYVGPPAGPWTLELAGAVTGFGAGPVAFRGTSVYARENGAWAALGDLPVEVTAAASGADGAAFAGSQDGRVWRRENDAWVSCAALGNADVPAIVGITTADALVYVATGSHAPWRSDDGCATWRDVGVGEDAQYGSDGDAQRPSDAWPVLYASGDHVVVGGWAGLYSSADGGTTWVDSPVIPADYTRSVAFDASFAEDSLVYLAAYGAGPLATDDGGASFTATNAGLKEVNAQRVAVPEAGSRDLLVVDGHDGFRSRNGGESWVKFGGEQVGDFFAWEDVGDVWRVDLEGNLDETTNGGLTWQRLDDVTTALGGSAPRSAARFGAGRCVTAEAPERVVCDTGGGWCSVFDGDVGTPTAPVAVGDRLVFGDEDGVHLSDDDGETWTTVDPAPGDPIQVMTSSDDGTLFLATRTAQVMRSQDEGVTWSALGGRLPAHVYTLAPRPGYAETPDLLIGTHDGTFLCQGAAGPVRWAQYQRIDASGYLATCTDCPDPAPALGRGMGDTQPLRKDSVLTAWVRGDQVDTLGAGGCTSGDLVATIDGVDVGDPREGVDLSPGWHRVEIRAPNGSASVDAIEGRTASATVTVPTPTRGCAGALVWLTLPLLWRGRRR